jgi:CheY-like chemotaxis protein
MWGFAMTSPSWPDQFPLPKFSSGRMRLILSVDDEPAILSTRQSILESAGFRVLSASDGEAALRLFSSQPVELVLLDYLMPGLDGGAVAKEMKRQRQHVPVILVSASPVPEDILTCVDSRCDKGAGPGSLLKTVAEFLGDSSTESSVRSEPGYGVPGRDRQPNWESAEADLSSNDKCLSASVRNSPAKLQQPPEKMSDILTCWKEIAQYFGKGVRTVQRWEHEAGLPIRRHNGAKGRVFATTQELDAWIQSATSWIEGNSGNSEFEMATLRKKVTELTLENEMLRHRLAKLEEKMAASKTGSGDADLRPRRVGSLTHLEGIRASQNSERSPCSLSSEKAS